MSGLEIITYRPGAGDYAVLSLGDGHARRGERVRREARAAAGAGGGAVAPGGRPPRPMGPPSYRARGWPSWVALT
jgi:hypothetical protein